MLRGMKFDRIIGQKLIIEKLVRSVWQERVSHAQVLAGPQGCGKLALAIAFAQFVSCENRLEADSCGTCPSCVKYEKLIHPDLHFVFPVIRSSPSSDPVSDNFIAEWRKLISESPYFNLNQWLSRIGVKNEQGLIYASEAGEIIKKLSLKTYESDYKVMIIWLPEKMHQATANKLLKMIEEPPAKTLFLLVSEEPDMVLPTIMSRCQFVRVPSIAKQDLKEELISNFDIEERKAAMLAHLSRGNFLRATGLIINDESRNNNLDNFIKLMRLAYQRDIPVLAEWTDEIAGSGRELQKSFLSFCLTQLRENYILNIGESSNDLVYLEGDEANFAKKFSTFINDNNISELTKEFSLAHSHISANGNPKIIFLDLSLKVCALLRR